MVYLNAFALMLPVLLLVLVGVFFRRTHFLRAETVTEMKKLVVNVTLPLVLFNAFATMQFELRYLAIVAAVFLLNVLVVSVSWWVVGRRQDVSPFFPHMMTGFEAGMMGYAIFGAVYGTANISKLAVVDLGQVLFVFLVLISSMQRGQGAQWGVKQTLRSLMRTPPIIGISLGVLANLSGVYRLLQSWSLTIALLTTMGLLAGLTMPLVAIILGYELQIKPGSLGRPLRTVALRLTTWVLLGLAMNTWLIGGWLKLDAAFQAAVMLLFVLPPAFVIPLYMRADQAKEQDYVLNTLSIATLAALLAIMVVRVLYPA